MVRGGTHPTDTHVGKRLRMRRLMLGLSQTKIANALGLSFQQVQKYEKGANRIGASRLRHLSQILEVPETFFFEGVPQAHDQHHAQTDAPSPQYVSDYLATPEALDLTRAFMQIPDAKLRRAIVKLVEQLAAAEDR
jgi:transcriptional regulator with XRE-family HTH domain